MSLGPPPYPVINESTVVVQVPTSVLSAGQAALVYLSTTAIPGQLVTVHDARGFLSSPQTILVSTTGGAMLLDGATPATSTLLRQRYASLTLHADTPTRWSIVNAPSFSDPAAAYTRRAADIPQLATSTTTVASLLSSLQATAVVATVSSLAMTTTLYASSLAVANFADYLAPPFRATSQGGVRVYGSTATIGSLLANGDIAIGGDLFTGGSNVSSRNGVIGLGGDLITLSSLRSQRAPSTGVFYARYATIDSTLTAGGELQIQRHVTAVGGVSTQALSTTLLTTSSLETSAALQFGAGASPAATLAAPAGAFILSGSAATATTASLSTASVTATGTIVTTTLTADVLAPTSAIAALLFSTAIINNSDGSLTTSSAQAVGTVTLASQALQTSLGTATAPSFQLLDCSANGQIISFPPAPAPPYATSFLSTTAHLSSLGPATGAFFAPTSRYETLLTSAGFVQAAALLSISGVSRLSTTQTSTLTGLTRLVADGLPILSFRSTPMTVAAIATCSTFAGTVAAAALSAQELRAPAALSWSVPHVAFSSLTASTLVARTLQTSSLALAAATLGTSAAYSTLNLSTPWMAQDPANPPSRPYQFSAGLGSAYNPLTYTSMQSGTWTYSLINPASQVSVALSTPYVDTIIYRSPYILTEPLVGQPASDASANLYYSDIYRGACQVYYMDFIMDTMELKGGRSRYYYGDGGPATSAALGAPLRVTSAGSNTFYFTDASSGRIRATYPNTRIESVITFARAPIGLSFNAPNSIYFAEPTLNSIYLNGVLVVGTGIAGYSGDGGPATAAELRAPQAVHYDSATSTLFLADTSNNVVRRVGPTGTITTVAGTGTPGYSGDGGPATAAELRAPQGLAYDTATSTLFIADTNNHVIRSVSAAGTITTIAGTGSPGYSGNAAPATTALFFGPKGVTYDASNNVLYIADTENHCIRRLAVGSGIVTTIAGTPTQGGFSGDTGLAILARLSLPTSVALDLAGNKYVISDEGNLRLRYVDLATLRIRTLAGNGSPFVPGDGGPATDAMFQQITCIAADADRNLYLVDSPANTVRKITAATGIITTIAGTGTAGYGGDGGDATAALLHSPYTAVLDSASNVYVTDEANARVRKITAATGIITTVAGNGVSGYGGDGGPATAASLAAPRALAIDSATSDLYIGDTSNYRIRKVAAATGVITTYAGLGYQDPVQAGLPPANTAIQTVTALAWGASPAGSPAQLYFTELERNLIWRASTTVQPVCATSTVTYLGDKGPLSTALFSTPTGVILDASGRLVITDAGNYRFRRSYTFGLPQVPAYLNLALTYTNYSTTAGSATVSLNGNIIKTFSAATGSNDSFTLTDYNTYTLPIQPIYGEYIPYTPYLQITQTGADGYTLLRGSAWLNQISSQTTRGPSVLNSTAGITMNFGRLVFPSALEAVTIDNRLNDASTRSLTYTGSLVNASDPVVKEDIRPAALSRLAEIVETIPLRRFQYCAAYRSTFQVQDQRQLGILATDLAVPFPHSVTTIPAPSGVADAPLSSIRTVETSQLRYAHLGATQLLLAQVSTLEAAVAALSPRPPTTQRNGLL